MITKLSRSRLAGKSILGLLLLLSAAGLGGDAVSQAQAQTQTQAGGERHAGLVVQFAASDIRTYCVTFSGDSISGLDLLLKSGLDIRAEAYGGMGGLICKIGPQGCDYPQQACACQSYGPGGVYWSYTHLINGGWKTAQQGASSYRVRNGDVEGWAWSSGKGPGVTPSFGQICPSLQLAQPRPISTAVPTPPPPAGTAPPTIAPQLPTATTRPPLGTRPPAVGALPSATRRPSATPSPRPSATPRPTLAPTRQAVLSATATSRPLQPTRTEAPENTPAPPSQTPTPTNTPVATSTNIAVYTPTVVATLLPTETATYIVAATPSAPSVQPTATQASAQASSSPQSLAQALAVGIALAVVGGLLLVRYVGGRGGRRL